MRRALRFLSVGVLALAPLALFVGCEGGDGGGGGSGGNVVGTWQVDDGMWWKFNSDGTFVAYNDSALTSAHLSGTYSQSGNKVTGSFSNPGVGDGEIDCTIGDDGRTMQMDFIEHWHTPYKHVPHNGTKV